MTPGHVGVVAMVVAHMGAAAAFFGSYLFTYVVVLPRARRAIDSIWGYEHFVATLNHGLRYAFFAGYALLVSSGAALAWLLPQPGRGMLLIAKAILLLASVSIFCYTSWRLWPRRTFAAESEIAAIQASFTRLGVAQLVIITLASVLGVVLGHG